MDACLSRRRLLLPLLVAWTVALGLVLATPARSAPGLIVRCTTADGGSVYTDRACALSGARPAPMSGALVARLVTEAHVARDQGVDASLPLGVDATGAPATHPLVARRPAADGRPVAIQDPCHLRHVQRAHENVRAVLNPYVSQLVELDDEGLCCGAGGAYAAMHADLAAEIRARKVAAIERSGVTVVASANPGCMVHLRNAGLDVRHPVTLIDEAVR